MHLILVKQPTPGTSNACKFLTSSHERTLCNNVSTRQNWIGMFCVIITMPSSMPVSFYTTERLSHCYCCLDQTNGIRQYHVTLVRPRSPSPLGAQQTCKVPCLGDSALSTVKTFDFYALPPWSCTFTSASPNTLFNFSISFYICPACILIGKTNKWNSQSNSPHPSQNKQPKLIL